MTACAWCHGTDFAAKGLWKAGWVEVPERHGAPGETWSRYHFWCEGEWTATQKRVSERMTLKGPATSKPHRNNQRKRSR